jgi:outer membrane protein assembly factor BamB
VNAKIAEIEKANTDRQPMRALAARRDLLAQYPEVAGDPRLAKLLDKTLQVEKSLVVREELNKPALLERTRTSASSVEPGRGDAGTRREVSGSPKLPKALCLAVHTRSLTEEQSGRPVFVLAKDCCYAVDHVTGDPLWRRVIGFDSPFFPMSVETSRPGLLLFDTNRMALVLVARGTGEEIWEQPLGEAISGPPLVNQGQIYLATLGSHLYQIDLETGRVSTRISFSQKILSPPALVRNNERLIVAGDASLIYTLSTAPLACIRVTDLGHPAGSLVDGVQALGGLVLITETGRPSGTLLHVLQAKDDDTWLARLATETIEGQVRDAPVVYGTMLFVPSVPARITAFAVSDAPGHESVTQTTSLAIPKQEDSPIFLLAGPDGQLWMAGSSLRRLKLALSGRSFALDPIETAIGISSQPLQVVGQYLFAARRLPYAGSVFFSQVDREPMAGQWRTVFGSTILAHFVPTSGDLVLIGEAGGVFSVSAPELAAGGFKETDLTSITPPAGTTVPLRATDLGHGRVAVDCAGAPSKVWIVGQLGQVESSFALPQPLEAPPVQLDSGIVLPLPGRLRLVSSSGGVSVAEDYLAAVEKGKPSAWKATARLDANNLLALDSSGRLARLQFRSDPLPHLAAVVTKTIDRPIDQSPCVVGSRVVFVDSDAELHVLDTAALQPVFTAKLSSPAIGMWQEGSSVLIETRDHDLLDYDLSSQPKSTFRVALHGTGPAGRSQVIGGRLIVPCRDGTVLALDPSTGVELSHMFVGQPLSGDAIDFHGQPVVTSVDGSLYSLEAAATSKALPASKAVPASNDAPALKETP